MWPAFGQSARSSVLPGGLPNQSTNRLIRIGKEFSKLPRNPVTFLPFVAACSQQSRFPLLQFQITVQIFLLLIKNKMCIRDRATAAFVPSLITTAAMFAMIFVWLEYRARKFTGKGLTFNDPSLKYQLTEEELSTEKDKTLPHWLTAFLPIIIILVTFNIFQDVYKRQLFMFFLTN